MEMVNMVRLFSTWHMPVHIQDVPLYHAHLDPVAVVKITKVVRGMDLELVKTAFSRKEY